MALDLTAQVGVPDGKPDPNRELPDRKVEPEIKTGVEGIGAQLTDDPPGDQLTDDPPEDQQHVQVIGDVHRGGAQGPMPTLDHEKAGEGRVIDETDQATVLID